jgi:hypothetical protein
MASVRDKWLQEERISHLIYAFNERDRLAKELAETDDFIAQEGRQYWKFLGYTVMPRLEKLRIAIMGE